jgi:hypothetical protein
MTAFMLSGHYAQEVGGSVAGIVVLVELALSGLFLYWFFRMHTRVGVAIDRDAGTVEPGYGFLYPFMTDCVALSEFHRLCIGIQEYHYGRIVEVKYHLTLEGVGGREVLIGRSSEYGSVRVMAEEVGKLLGMDVLDATADQPVLLAAAVLGKSLREQPRADKVLRRNPPAG